MVAHLIFVLRELAILCSCLEFFVFTKNKKLKEENNKKIKKIQFKR